MSLHREVLLTLQLPKTSHCFNRATRRKPRGQNWGHNVEAWINLLDVLNHLLRLPDARFCRLIAVVVWVQAFVVHTDPPDKGALAYREAEIREQVGGGNINGSVVGSGGSAMRQGTADTSSVDLASLG